MCLLSLPFIRLLSWLRSLVPWFGHIVLCVSPVVHFEASHVLQFFWVFFFFFFFIWELTTNALSLVGHSVSTTFIVWSHIESRTSERSVTPPSIWGIWYCKTKHKWRTSTPYATHLCRWKATIRIPTEWGLKIWSLNWAYNFRGLI